VKAVTRNNPQSVSIVVPVHNEESTIAEVVRQLAALDLGAVRKEVVLIDDGSTDGTPLVLGRLIAQYPDVLRAERTETRRGKGAALRRGLALSEGDVIVIHDADLELAPAEIPRVVNAFFEEGVDVVYGSRFLERSDAVPRLSFWANRVLTGFTNLLYGAHLSDMETACKAFRREVMTRLELRSEGFEIEPEITAELLKKGYRIREVPVSYRPRSSAAGKKVSWADGLTALGTLLRCRFIA